MPSFDGGQKSAATFERYNGEGILLTRQFVKESDRSDLGRMHQEEVSVAACHWLLDQHFRWSASHIRLKCAIFTQRIELHLAAEMISKPEAEKLLSALKNQRPKPAVRGGQRHPNRREQRPQNKVVRPKNLRRLVRELLAQQDEFSTWVAGYLQIGSRIGWRPGEVIAMQLTGRVLSVPGKKVTNGRGLAPAIEIIIGDNFPEKYLQRLRSWIAETRRWSNEYGGSESLRAAMREQVRRACNKLGIPMVAPYALRHFAVSCMKRSGWSAAEIAAVVNHASDRTAGERYGKGRNGIKRPRGLFRVDPARVARVRHSARKFVPLAERAKRKKI